MTEQTLILVKPDGVRRGYIGEILKRIENKGYKVVDLRMLQASEDQLREHYHEHVNKPFFPGLVEYMISGPMVAAIVEGVRVIEGIRSLAGATDPTSAAPGTIRGDLGCALPGDAMENLIHSSDSPESAAFEIGVWF
ncbi:MAG: nucleoside-diphosphate kinase [Actinomycetaceae bacterium]|nr:nucleoside-diphosphate kinase [Actinomycetaceae bacterium]